LAVGRYQLYHGNANWAPSLTFYHAAAISGSPEPIGELAGVVKDLLHETWEVIGWESFNELNQKTGEAELLLGGVWTGDQPPVKWCYTVTLTDGAVGGHESIKYFRGLSEEMFTSGAPAAGLLSTINDLGAMLVGQGFTNIDGVGLTGATFGTVSRRGKIRRRLQI